MLVGVPREIKDNEYRVGLTPSTVRELVARGHHVIVEAGVGETIDLEDDRYVAAGAEIVPDAASVFGRAELVVKVKEPQPSEIAMLRDGQVLFTYLHLAPDLAQTKGLMDSGCVAIAYETVTDESGGLPLLAPMSEVAGRMSIQAGAHALEREAGGRGVLLGGVPGVPPAKVVVLGGGVVGMNALRMALGLEADVTVLDRSLPRLKELDLAFAPALKTRYSTTDALEESVLAADLVIGAVLIPGAAAPKLVTREMIRGMRRGTVVVDVSIDQGGCFETSRPTTHSESDLRRGWRGPLLRHQHAGRRGPDIHVRPEQRHAAVHPGPRRQGLSKGHGRRQAPSQRPQRLRRQDHPQSGRGCASSRVRGPGEGAWFVGRWWAARGGRGARWPGWAASGGRPGGSGPAVAAAGPVAARVAGAVLSLDAVIGRWPRTIGGADALRSVSRIGTAAPKDLDLRPGPAGLQHRLRHFRRGP